MKREYKFISIYIVNLIVMATIGLLALAFNKQVQNSDIFALILGLVVGLFRFAFDFSIAGGLIRNRMGSVGDYLNQVNYINFRVLTVAFIISLITSVLAFFLKLTSGMLVFSAIANPNNDSVFSVGTFLLPIIILVVDLVFALLVAYSTLYLADSYNVDEPVFKSIKNILLIGKRLIKKTLVIVLKFVILPIFIFVGILAVAFMVLGDDPLAIYGAIVFPVLIYASIANVIIKARLSDKYLDVKYLE